MTDKKYETPCVRDMNIYRDHVALMNGRFETPKAAGELMNVVRAELQKAEVAILEAFDKAVKEGTVKCNGAYFERGLMQLQAGKDALCCSVILPYWDKPPAAATAAAAPAMATTATAKSLW